MEGLRPLFTLKYHPREEPTQVFFNAPQVISVQESTVETVYITVSSGEIMEVISTFDLAIKKIFNVSIDKPHATPKPSE